jgi:hypothetical protein
VLLPTADFYLFRGPDFRTTCKNSQNRSLAFMAVLRRILRLHQDNMSPSSGPLNRQENYMGKLYDIAAYENRRHPNEDKKPGLAKLFNIADHIRWQGTHESAPVTPMGPGTFTLT